MWRSGCIGCVTGCGCFLLPDGFGLCLGCRTCCRRFRLEPLAFCFLGRILATLHFFELKLKQKRKHFYSKFAPKKKTEEVGA